MEINMTFVYLVIIFAIVLSLLLIIYFVAQSEPQAWRYAIIAVLGLSLCATVYILFFPSGGINTGTMSLLHFWGIRILGLSLGFTPNSEVIPGLTLRRILIWPCLIADVSCIYAYIKLNKKRNNNDEK